MVLLERAGTPDVDAAQTGGLIYTRLGAGDRRQCVLSSALDSNGQPSAITTGSGLRPGLDLKLFQIPNMVDMSVSA